MTHAAYRMGRGPRRVVPGRPRVSWEGLASVLVLGVGLTTPGMTAPVPLTVPNASFESPATPFVSLVIHSWERTPKPDWYVEEGGFLWGQLTGIFLNTAPSQPDHIVNMDGRQAAWVFAVPEAGFFQGVRTSSDDGAARFEPGQAYRLTLDAMGGSGNMLPGVTLEASLFRWDAASNRVPVLRLTVAHDPVVFPDNTRFKTFTATLPPVADTDVWAGQVMGVQILSTATAANQGGYWDVDRVRVESIPVPRPELRVERMADGRLRLAWASEAGWRYRLATSSDLGTWTEGAEEWPGTGAEQRVTLPAGAGTGTFFRVGVRPAE